MSIQNNVQRTFLIARSFVRFQNFKNCVYLPNKKKILIWACFTCSTFSLNASNSFSLLTIIFGPFRKRFFGHRKRYRNSVYILLQSVNTIESKKEFMGYYAGLICIVNYVHSYVHFDQIIYLVIHWFDETIVCFHSI